VIDGPCSSIYHHGIAEKLRIPNGCYIAYAATDWRLRIERYIEGWRSRFLFIQGLKVCAVIWEKELAVRVEGTILDDNGYLTDFASYIWIEIRVFTQCGSGTRENTR
jgi:hypothetical protein